MRDLKSFIGRMEYVEATDPGKPRTAHRLWWVLMGCPGWVLRSIAREEGFRSTSEFLIVKEARRKGRVRAILSTYLRLFEKDLMEIREINRQTKVSK